MRRPYPARELFEARRDIVGISHDRSEQQRIGGVAKVRRRWRFEQRGRALHLAGVAEPLAVNCEHPMHVLLYLVPRLILRRRKMHPYELGNIEVGRIAAVP